MRCSLPFLVLALIAWPGSVLGAATAQVPGDYPHLVVDDLAGTEVPSPGSSFDSSGVFESASGGTFEARIEYEAWAQSNTNVVWGLLVSAEQTPLPTNVIPPPLFPMPPLILILPPAPNLDVSGRGTFPLQVPPGMWGTESYVQGIVYDVTNTPAVQLSNGVTIRTRIPDFNVTFTYTRDSLASDPTTPQGLLEELGTVDLDAATLPGLAPLGTGIAPAAVSGTAGLSLGSFRFLPILPNLGDEPLNPRARPVTALTANINDTTTTLPVVDTMGFPSEGKLLIAFAGGSLWKDATFAELVPPNVEVVAYSDITPTAFLGCQRWQLGSMGLNGNHAADDTIVGPFTMASTAGARSRSRVSLDATNPDSPHVVLPSSTFNGPSGSVTRNLDLFAVEKQADGSRGFAVLDRVTQRWELLDGSFQDPTLGSWDPMVHVVPDNRCFIAVLRVLGGAHGWDHDPDQVWAFRLDGLDWPATGTPEWQLTYDAGSNPTPAATAAKRRRIWMPSLAVVGPDPENYVLYAGVANKWKQSDPGNLKKANEGFEAEYVRVELMVTDFFEMPLIPPGSSKTLPVQPAPFIRSQFGVTGALEGAIIRFDSDVVLSDDGTMMLVTGGSELAEEDVFVLRNVTVKANGTVSKILANITGHNNSLSTSAGKSRFRNFQPGAHGHGRRAAFSPNKTRAAFVAWDAGNVFTQSKFDWLQVARTNSSDFGKVTNVYANANGKFKEPGDYRGAARNLTGLRFIDEDRLIFFMGASRLSAPLSTPPALDLFAYDIPNDLMTNLTKTLESAGSGFDTLGNMAAAASFASPNGKFVYFVRAGGAGVNSSLALDTPVTNVFGMDYATMGLFDVTGQEFGGLPFIGHVELPGAELQVPVETVTSMQFTEGSGTQQGMMFFVAHRVQGVQDADDVFGFNMNSPFIAFSVTQASDPGAHVSNLTPDPYSGKLAFARSDTSDRYSSNQHLFVVDMDSFMFERDLLPEFLVSGAFMGRVMDGSLHFIAPAGNAPDALVFSFGEEVRNGGVAHLAQPYYYSLGSVANTLVEPKPILVPLLDVSALGGDFRFLLTSASSFLAPGP